MDYGGILKRTWQITWRNKAWWLLGILASCSGGGRGGGSGGNFSSYNIDQRQMRGADQAFQRLMENETFWIVLAVAILILVLLSILFLALGVIGQGGLIAAFHKADQNAILTLGEAFQHGVQRFWRLLAVQLIIGLGVFLAVLILLIPGIAAAVLTGGLALSCLLPLLCLLVPLLVLFGLAIPVYLQFTQMAIVVEGRGIADSLRRAWEVIRANLGPVLVMALILILGSVVVQTVLALPFLAALVPIVTGILLQGDVQTAGIALTALCVLAYLPVLIVMGGIVQTYVSGAWTLSYLRWIERPMAARSPG